MNFRKICPNCGSADIRTISKDKEEGIVMKKCMDCGSTIIVTKPVRDNAPKYDYETISKNGSKYGFIVHKGFVNVYVDDIEWGCPNGDRFIEALIDDIKELQDRL